MERAHGLGHESTGLKIQMGDDQISIIPQQEGVEWRGRIDLEHVSFLRLLDEGSGASRFNERDEFTVLYRTRELAAVRVDATGVIREPGVRWLIELRHLSTRMRCVFTSDEWNEMLDSATTMSQQIVVDELSRGTPTSCR